jgi:hypothetical protein
LLSHPAYSSISIWTTIFWLHAAFNIKHSITIVMWVRESVSSNSTLVLSLIYASLQGITLPWRSPSHCHRMYIIENFIWCNKIRKLFTSILWTVWCGIFLHVEYEWHLLDLNYKQWLNMYKQWLPSPKRNNLWLSLLSLWYWLMTPINK